MTSRPSAQSWRRAIWAGAFRATSLSLDSTTFRFSAYMQPPLTTVEQPTIEQGRIAGRMLVERLTHQHDRARREELLSCRLIVRKSCGTNA